MFTLSAFGGCPDAQYELAVRYEEGEDVEKNLPNAMEYYKMAAENGCIESQCKLKSLIVV
jgi:TPR repeat protein